HYRTPRWVPHCTIGQELSRAQIERAWPHLHTLGLPLEGRFEGLELVRFRPVEVLATAPLGDSPLEYAVIEGADPRLVDQVMTLYPTLFEGITPDEQAMVREEIGLKPRLATVTCHVDGELVGFKMGFRRGPGQFHSWLGGVHGNWRRGGIATELMVRQHRWCADQGYQVIRTITVQAFAAMFALNLAHGFEVVGTMSSGRGLKLVMEKGLH